MRKIALSAVGLAAVATFVVNSGSDAATTTADLSMTGNVVAGVRSAQYGQEVPFLFTLKNRSTSTSADVAFTFSVRNGSVSSEDYVCPLISNHFDINPDSPSCEPGFLSAGKATQAAVLVTPNSGVASMTVKACAENDSSTDPISSNNCKVLSIGIS